MSIKKQPPITIAILLPIYNGSEYFKDALLSILRQTYNNWELYIGINGHPINSDIYNNINQIIKPLIKKYKIKLFDFGEPGNKSQTLNKMVRLLPPIIHHIALLDVDDIWHPNKLSYQIPLLQMYNPYHIIGTRCKYFGSKDIIPFIPIGDFTDDHDFKKSNPIINSSVIIYRPLAVWNEKTKNGLEDYELWLHLKKNKNIRFYNCPQILVNHRIHYDSAFNGENTQYIDELLTEF